MGKNNEQKEIFGKQITNIGTANTLEEFISLIRSKGNDSNDTTLFFRGETKDYGSTALLPQLFRVEGWLKNEHELLNDYVAKFPDMFPKGTSTFEIMVYADHYGLPVRLLDITSSAFTGLFMACFNYKGQEETSPENDGMVYIFKVKNDKIKNWNSDTVTLLSNVARMESNFLTNEKDGSTNLTEKEWWLWMKKMMHIIKDEKPDFYYMHSESEMSKYKEDFNHIVCVRPKMINSRILNQKGAYFLFGINGKKSDYNELSFEETVVEIYSITIPGKHKPEFLKQLANCGCDKMTMFPDMENVCDAIKSNYGSYKRKTFIKYLVNELKSKYPKDITAIQIDETMAVVSFKDDNAIVIYKNHEVKVIQGFRKMFAKEKIPLTFQTIETTDKGYGITLISDGTENALDLGETKVLASFNLYKNEDESLDSFFNANGIAKCPDGLEDKLNTLLSAYKNIL
ncbi:MAG: FRG domain-containing protein [Bacteroidales bacterium]|nr:FRG domain-containing protein [Bacteroidales bacterium]